MESITTALITQMTEIGSSLTSLVTSTLPIALPIIGGVFLVTKGLSVFKRITNKA